LLVIFATKPPGAIANIAQISIILPFNRSVLNDR